MTHHKATLNDIADAASVSISTVTRYIHERGYVKPDKQKRIETAIAQLNYQPKHQSIARKIPSNMIGIIIPYDVMCSHFNAVLCAIEKSLHQHGLISFVTTAVHGEKAELARIKDLHKQGVDGVIVIGGRLSDHRLQQLRLNIPVVSIGNNQLMTENISSVSTNNVVGGYLATNYLLRLGHEKIVHICGNLSQPDGKQRLDGYYQALEKAGIPIRSELVIYGKFEIDCGRQAVETLISQEVEFSAIFAANDHMALGAISMLKEKGYSVPEQVSVIGFDDHEMATIFSPPLTTIRQPSQHYGEMAATHMLQHLA